MIGLLVQSPFEYQQITDLLFSLGYGIGLFAYAAMVVLAYRTEREFGDGVYWFFAGTGIALFAFGFGGQYFSVIYPGAVWLFGLVFVFGALVALLMFFLVGPVPGPFDIEDRDGRL